MVDLVEVVDMELVDGVTVGRVETVVRLGSWAAGSGIVDVDRDHIAIQEDEHVAAKVATLMVVCLLSVVWLSRAYSVRSQARLKR
eukprot:2383540-Amphidinium_carterae.1